MTSEIVEVEGHIIDSLILAKVLDTIVTAGAQYELLDVAVGRTNTDPSRARLEITADPTVLTALLGELQIHGVNPAETTDVKLEATDRDGVFPFGFYATTNLPTAVRIGGEWIEVQNPEMDCGLVVDGDGSVHTVPMHRVRAGQRAVVGQAGVRVRAPSRPRGPTPFEFMNSEVSSEKPKGLLLAEVAVRIQLAKQSGAKVLAVCGPAVIHTGAGPEVARLVRDGWIDVLFAGNGFAAHDVESNVLGTSLGVSVREGAPTEGGHANHLRVINEVRRHGSIAAAVQAGYLTSGVMYECIRAGVPFVLGGSLRDDGPLPEVLPNVLEAADAMRHLLPGVTVALMLATTLHAIATGNLLPSWVETYCVDINQAVVTKLADRGSHQALGIVTDVGLFLRGLAEHLDGDRRHE
jgi:lysine-ketoglutarate reductase/saccharopine dehydrogenase-like protein (TIGR00300 family)